MRGPGADSFCLRLPLSSSVLVIRSSSLSCGSIPHLYSVIALASLRACARARDPLCVCVFLAFARPFVRISVLERPCSLTDPQRARARNPASDALWSRRALGTSCTWHIVRLAHRALGTSCTWHAETDTPQGAASSCTPARCLPCRHGLLMPAADASSGSQHQWQSVCVPLSCSWHKRTTP